MRYTKIFFPKIFRSRVSKEFSRERAQRENRLGFRGPNLRKGQGRKRRRKKIVPKNALFAM